MSHTTTQKWFIITLKTVTLASTQFHWLISNEKQKQHQNFYKMLPEECSEWWIVRSAREALFSLKKMIKTEANTGGKLRSNLLVPQQPCGTRVTVCKSWHLFLENWMGCYNHVAMNEWTIVELVTAGITGKKNNLSLHVRFSEMENVDGATVPWLQLRNRVVFSNRGEFISRRLPEHQCTWQGKGSFSHWLQNLLSCLKSFWKKGGLKPVSHHVHPLCFQLWVFFISGNSEIYFSCRDLKNYCCSAINHWGSYKPLSCWEHLPRWGNVTDFPWRKPPENSV